MTSPFERVAASISDTISVLSFVGLFGLLGSAVVIGIGEDARCASACSGRAFAACGDAFAVCAQPDDEESLELVRWER